MVDDESSTLYRLATGIEENTALDGPVRLLERALPTALREGPMREVLGGRWLGHALHPMLTDFPLGAWTSATLLDLVGGKAARPAARRLVGFGILTAVPTALAGASDWTAATRQQRRVGVVHAASNTVGLACYTASWLARRRGKHWRGVALALAGGVAGTVGGFLGGHLSLAQDTGLRATASALEGGGSRASSDPFRNGDRDEVGVAGA